MPLIKEGMFVGYLSSRETAPRIGRQSGGAMRADGWNRIPLIRMTNVNLLPKPGMSFDDIVADTDDGLLFETNRSWSIDDRRLNFQFATEVCREIKGGKVGRLFRNGTYTGITYELWRSMDAVGDASSWRMWGTPNCGKGEPPARRATWATACRVHGSATCAWGWWHERRGRHRQRPGGGAPPRARRSSGWPRLPAAGRGRGARRGRRLRAHPVRQQRDPPERGASEVFVNLRFVQGRRVGVASTGRVDAEGVRALVERAAAIAANVEELEDWAGLPEAGAADPLPEAWSDGTATASPELRAEGARAVIAAADEAGVTAYGSFSTDAEAIAVATSKGIRAAERRTTSQLLTVTMGPDNGTGYAEQVSVDATAIDAAAIGREAAERARASRQPRRVDPGDYPVVLQHYAVVDLLDMLGYLGFSALAVPEDRSFCEPRTPRRLAPRHDRRRRARPRRPADGLRRRGRPEAAPLPPRRGRVPGPRVRRPDRRPRRARLHRPRPAGARTRTARSPRTWSWPPATRPRTSWSAGWTAGCSSRASTTRTRSTPRR